MVQSSKFHQNWTIKGLDIQDFVRCKMVAAGILEVAQNLHFHHFSVKYVSMVLPFKFHQNQTINGPVMQDFVKFTMAAAAILDVAQTPAFTIFQ